MNISPITPSSFGIAADVLDRGFPEVGDRNFWLRVLYRIERWRPQGAAYPSGFFLEIDAAIKGVVLMACGHTNRSGRTITARIAI